MMKSSRCASVLFLLSHVCTQGSRVDEAEAKENALIERVVEFFKYVHGPQQLPYITPWRSRD